MARSRLVSDSMLGPDDQAPHALQIDSAFWSPWNMMAELEIMLTSIRFGAVMEEFELRDALMNVFASK